ncbi:YdeI/OmpD-associated family protein [Segetibacter aerophilus]|nr:YdeI/OmpD-associated family protein [Segetibacter aerophilus]
MPQTICQKLKIKDEMNLLTLHAPPDFASQLQPLPKGVNISTNLKKYDQVHWFVLNKEQLDKEVEGVVAMIKDAVVCWIYYPKITSKIKTDLTRDKGWDSLLKHTELQWLSLVAFNETWSAFAFRLKTAADEKKESKAEPREIFNYVDSANKTVRLPEDLALQFEQNRAAFDLFQQLSFTNKKEYVEWIVTAKRNETRSERLKGTVERLLKGWKNPSNR